jgi:hypothetical protein
VKFGCPSCVVTIRCPDKCAGLTILCPKCKTQVTVPGVPGEAETRSWLTSRGWQAVLAVGALAIIGFVVSLAVLLLAGEPGGSAAFGPLDGPAPAVARLGETYLLEWKTPLEPPGGYFRVTGLSVQMELPDHASLLIPAQAEDNPWPASLVGESEGPPSRAIRRVRLHLTLPTDEALRRQRVTLRVEAGLEHLHQAPRGSPLAVRTETLDCRQPLLLAGEEDLAALQQATHASGALRWVVFGSAMVILIVGMGVYTSGRRRITIMCPHCGRAAPVYYTHEKGDYTVSPCPHRNAGPMADAE